MADRVTVRLDGDESDLVRSFDKAGQSAKGMAKDIDRASSDSKGSFGNLEGAVDSSEGKFRGLGDTIGGTGDIMDGFRTGNVAQMAMGFADLAGGIKDFILPALTTLSTVLKTQVAGAMTFVSAHPLMVAILAGGAIIAGLILLETKFGLVSGAVEALGGVFTQIWPGIKAVINQILGGLEFIANAAITAITAPVGILNKIPGVKSIVPDVPKVSLPRVHTGGMVPGVAGQETLALLQAGETVLGRGQPGRGGITINVSGVGMGRDFGMAVAQALRDNKLLGVT